MTSAEMLAVLKLNLQMVTAANDQLLTHMLDQGHAAMLKEGIVDDGSIGFQSCVIDYAAYLFRRRAASPANGANGETGMPRFLRYQLNNLLFSQKVNSL